MIIFHYRHLQKFIIYLFIFSFINASDINAIDSPPSSNLTNRTKYTTDEKGNILMHINVWGHVKLPGNHLVYEGIDLISLLSIVGGPYPGADMKNIILIRETSDMNGKTKYQINLDSFYKDGNRKDLIKILPNDTIIIKEKLFRNILNKNNILSSLLQMLNIYLQIQIINDTN
jgi:hypothetical protein